MHSFNDIAFAGYYHKYYLIISFIHHYTNLTFKTTMTMFSFIINLPNCYINSYLNCYSLYLGVCLIAMNLHYLLFLSMIITIAIILT